MTAVRQYFLNSRSEMAAFLPASFSHTLEIGCGSGAFSDAYLGAAKERWGIEPDPGAAAIATTKFNKFYSGFYEDIEAELPTDYFDLVICNDVIEHMPDHDAFLRSIATKMKAGGLIVGSVPNIRHFTALVKMLLLKDFPYAEDGILDRTHKRFFTMKSLKRAFIENGYRVEALKGIRSILPSGVTGMSPLGAQASRVAAATLILVTLGWWADTQYPQIGFRVARGPSRI